MDLIIIHLILQIIYLGRKLFIFFLCILLNHPASSKYYEYHDQYNCQNNGQNFIDIDRSVVLSFLSFHKIVFFL